MWQFIKSFFSLLGEVFKITTSGVKSANIELKKFNQRWYYNEDLYSLLKVMAKEGLSYRFIDSEYYLHLSRYIDEYYASEAKGVYYFDYKVNNKIYCYEIKLSHQKGWCEVMLMGETNSRKLIENKRAEKLLN